MRSNRSIADVLTRLETQAGFHRDRESYHAQQEEQHRQQRSHHAAELEQITQRLEAFRAAAAAALDLADRINIRPEPGDEGENLGPAYRPRLGRMVQKVIDALEDTDRFGPAWVTREVNRRFGKGLRKPASTRQISVVLRRMERYGRIHLVREGRPHHEALYSRAAPGSQPRS